MRLDKKKLSSLRPAPTVWGGADPQYLSRETIFLPGIPDQVPTPQIFGEGYDTPMNWVHGGMTVVFPEFDTKNL
jgi:hypothetical protein